MKITDIEDEDLHQSEWIARALSTRPEILELYERTRPLSGKETFGRSIATASTEAKHAMSHNNGIQNNLY